MNIIGILASPLKNNWVCYPFGSTKIFSKIDLIVAQPWASGGDFSPSASAGVSNNKVAGYLLGGDYTGPSRTVSKLLFVTEARTVTANVLTYNTGYVAGFTNSGTAGYVTGGLSTSYTRVTTSNKFLYSNDTASSIGAITTSRGYSTGMSNNGVAGYTAGGFTTAYVGTVDKRIYSNDSTSQLGTGLITGRQYPTSLSNHGTCGYIAGGQNSGSTRVNSIEKWTYSNDSRATISATLTNQANAPTGTSLSGSHGYLCGGSNSAGSASTTSNQKLLYSNDTISTMTSLFSADWYAANGIETW